MSVSAALAEIESWPAAEQIELIQQVWERLLLQGWQPELSAEQKAEIDRRLQDFETHPDNVTTWDNIVQRLERRP